MKYLKFTTQEAFETFNNQMNTIKGYDDGKGTHTYTSCSQGTDEMFYAPVREADLPLLDEIEQNWECVVDEWPRPEVEEPVIEK